MQTCLFFGPSLPTYKLSLPNNTNWLQHGNKSSIKMCYQITLAVGASVSSLTRLDLTNKENMLIFGCSEAAESKLAKLETSDTSPNSECSLGLQSPNNQFSYQFFGNFVPVSNLAQNLRTKVERTSPWPVVCATIQKSLYNSLCFIYAEDRFLT